jgi:hypothetical protein
MLVKNYVRKGNKGQITRGQTGYQKTGYQKTGYGLDSYVDTGTPSLGAAPGLFPRNMAVRGCLVRVRVYTMVKSFTNFL